MPSNCGLCGEPMPAGEEMFQYHGYSGPCPKPPLPRATVETVIEYLYRDQDGEFFLIIRAGGQDWQVMAFDTETERQRAHDDLLNMMRACGAKDLPAAHQN